MKRAKLFLAGFLFFGCFFKFYLLTPAYVLADIFYYMPASAMDNYDGEGRQGMVWFPITRIQHLRCCEVT